MVRVGDDIRLGKLLVGATHVLLTSPLRRFAALSDLSSLVHGHAVVVPLDATPESSALDDEGWRDLWRSVHLAQRAAELRVGSAASNLLLREGQHAAWDGAPFHVHICPRIKGDLERSDEIFDLMEKWKPAEMGAASVQGPPGWQLPDDADRRDRTPEAMAAEASEYREWLASHAGALAPEASERAFSRFPIPADHVFFDSPSRLTNAFVNLRPLVHGHVLVTPRRVTPRLADLSDDERDDLWRAVRVVQRCIRETHGGATVELGVQDGADAGQSVPHVHVHVIPRAAAPATK
jgi:diadenosine tetraphosphate (Ap4A) HIT family hydrolase